METVLTWDFSDGDLGWSGDFADYPVGEDEFFELDSGLRPLPKNLGDENGLFITGSNRSDDLFMYFRQEVEGLEPNTTYQVDFDLELASNASASAIGIGGGPGSSVFLKAGITLEEPLTVVDSSDDLRLNVDKGNQAQIGTDAVSLGNIAVPDDGTFDEDFELIERSNDEPFTFTTDDTGNAWIYFGTDSGFEGVTTLYYTDFTEELTPVNVIRGTQTADNLLGTDGADSIEGLNGRDLLAGGAGNDTIDGGGGRDILKGSTGDDLLDGSRGKDTLIGDSGSDRFVISTQSGTDLILDYLDGTDSFVLEDNLAFEQLNIVEGNNGAEIRLDSNNKLLATVPFVSASAIDEADFNISEQPV